jgi:hypothetical protein
MTDTTVKPIIVREGRPTRNSDELVRLFVHDVAAIALGPGSDPDDAADAVDLVQDLLLEEADAPYEVYAEWIEDIVSDADDLLEDMGFYVEWADGDDGYTIYRDTEGKS